MNDFGKKRLPRRNVALLFPPDAIFQPKNYTDRIKNLLQKISRT